MPDELPARRGPPGPPASNGRPEGVDRPENADVGTDERPTRAAPDPVTRRRRAGLVPPSAACPPCSSAADRPRRSGRQEQSRARSAGPPSPTVPGPSRRRRTGPRTRSRAGAASSAPGDPAGLRRSGTSARTTCATWSTKPVEPTASTRSAAPTSRRSPRCGGRSSERRSAGQHGGMSFTFRNPRRSTDPARLLRRRPDPGGRGPGLPRAPARADPTARSPPSPATPGGTTTPTCAPGWRPWPAVLRDHGHRAAVFVDDNALVDRAAAHRAGIGWWGRNSNLLVPGAGSWFVLGSVVTDAELPVTLGAGRRRLPLLHPLRVGVSHRRHRRRRGHRRPAVPGLAGAGRRRVPPGAPRRPRRPHLRLRRLPGGLPAGPARRHEVDRDEAGTPRSTSRRRMPGSQVLELLDPDVSDDGPARPLRPLVHPTARPSAPAPERARGARQRRRRAPIRRSVQRSPGGADDDDELLRAHAVWAAARLGLRHLVDGAPRRPEPPRAGRGRDGAHGPARSRSAATVTAVRLS